MFTMTQTSKKNKFPTSDFGTPVGCFFCRTGTFVCWIVGRESWLQQRQRRVESCFGRFCALGQFKSSKTSRRPSYVRCLICSFSHHSPNAKIKFKTSFSNWQKGSLMTSSETSFDSGGTTLQELMLSTLLVLESLILLSGILLAVVWYMKRVREDEIASFSHLSS